MSEIVKLRKPIGKVRMAAAGTIAHALPGLIAAEGERTTPPPQMAGGVAGVQRLSALPHPRLLEQELARGIAQGREQGREEGRREMEEQLQRERARIDDLAKSIQEQLHRLSDRLERDAFHFALAVAGKIVKREVSVDDEVVVRQVQEAIHRVVGVEAIKLRVHPLDEPMIRSRRSAFLASSDSVREMVIEADEKIEQGGCIIESSSGNVDARRATQLRQIEAALFPTAKEIE